MWKRFMYLVFVCLLLAATGSAAPIVITTADGKGADTYLANDSQSGTNGPDTVHGAENRMRAFRQLADTRSKTGYIRFDLGDATGDMSGAFLTFEATYLKGSGGTVQVYGLIDGDGDFWDEATLSYNTAAGVLPASLGNYALDTAKVTLLGTITTPAVATYPVVFSSNPTSLPLADFLQADTNKLVTFLFIGDDNEGEIASKEHETYNPPTLTLPNAVRGVRTTAICVSPANGAEDVSRDVVLSWTPGASAATHNVYLGTDSNAVAAGDAGVLASPGQPATTYDSPGHLAFDTTYYWRVDEVDAPPASTVHAGAVWSFTVEPLARQAENVIATASSFDGDAQPMNTVDGSGMTGDLHSTSDKAMWVTAEGDPQPWIRYEFDRVYMLHEMWVWNYNLSLEKSLGVGFKDVLIECSLDGESWIVLRDSERFNQGTSADNYAHNTTVDFNGVAARYVRLTPKSNWRGIMAQYGLSEVRFFYIPAHARVPAPTSGAVDVDPRTVVLSWRAGREAASHEVYLSPDAQAVAEGTALAAILTDPRYIPPSLLLGQTYSWKVVEVNQVETPSAWDGDVWDFSTLQFLPIDDFESYTNDAASYGRIFQTWIDGAGYNEPVEVPGNGSGAYVGHDIWDEEGPHLNKTIVETSIVRPGGRQSMPLYYDNSDPARKYYSETTRTWKEPQNWTIHGADTLRVWFRGGALGFEETAPGAVTMSAAGADIFGTTDEFTYAYMPLNSNGSITVRVDSVENTNAWAKAGVMIRESLYPDARHAMAYVTPDGRVGWEYRQLTANTTENTRSNPGAVTLPHWVRLSRQGDTITAAHSSDNVTWLPMVDADNPAKPSSFQLSMTASVFIGLALTSHAAGVTCTAEFSGITTSGSGAWQFAEIGVDHMLNDRADLYVTIRDASGRTGTARYPDGAVIDEWTAWDIPFAAFTGTGVNMAAVSTMAIGVGDRESPKAGGTGIVFIDDIGFGRKTD